MIPVQIDRLPAATEPHQKMMPNADAVTMSLLVLVAALVLGIIGYALSVSARTRRKISGNAAIRATIVEYFRRSGVAVSADCVQLADGRYTAIVESEPMKQFRLSHIIEMTLRTHVRKACGLELDKIYWRFPLKEAEQAAQAIAKSGDGATDPGPVTVARAAVAAAVKGEEISDEYINEGLDNYRHIPRAEVTELPWETFEEATTGGGYKKDPPA